MTVKVTVFAPVFAHVKVVTSAAKVTVEQLSVLPLSMSAAVIVAFPVPSR